VQADRRVIAEHLGVVTDGAGAGAPVQGTVPGITNDHRKPRRSLIFEYAVGGWNHHSHDLVGNQTDAVAFVLKRQSMDRTRLAGDLDTLISHNR
jgi:hypothetical protein